MTRPSSPRVTVEGVVRGALAAGVAVAAVTLLTASCLEALALLRLDAARGAVASAVALSRGSQRDLALDAAQVRVSEALAARPDDPRLWDLMAEVRFLQATEAQVEAVSPALLAVAIEASERAEALEPRLPAAPARLAVARALQGDAPRARAALRRAFETSRMPDLTAGLRRVRAAGRLWDDLDADARRSVRAELCVLIRDGQLEGLQAAVQAAAPPAEFVIAVLSVQQEPACRPTT